MVRESKALQVLCIKIYYWNGLMRASAPVTTRRGWGSIALCGISCVTVLLPIVWYLRVSHMAHVDNWDDVHAIPYLRTIIKSMSLNQ